MKLREQWNMCYIGTQRRNDDRAEEDHNNENPLPAIRYGRLFVGSAGACSDPARGAEFRMGADDAG